jgi:hypothetical protein
MCASVLVCDSTCGNAAQPAAPPGEGEAASEWEKGLAFGISLLENSVRERGLEETQRRQHEGRRPTTNTSTRVRTRSTRTSSASSS